MQIMRGGADTRGQLCTSHHEVAAASVSHCSAFCNIGTAMQQELCDDSNVSICSGPAAAGQSACRVAAGETQQRVCSGFIC